MEIKSKFDHFNINVTNLERSIAFYEKALGLKEHHRKEASDGSFTLVYLTDNETGFLLELTWLKDHTAPYELGENESHLCFRVAGDYDAIRAYHKEMNCVCFENTAMGLYFINDPDDYWTQNAREDGKLGAHRLQPLVNPRAFREHADVHNHHEQRQRQHALAHKQRERTHHRARQQPLNTRDIRHIRHHGQGVERHGPLMQRLPQREHSNNSRHENHKKRHGLPLTFVAGPRAH